VRRNIRLVVVGRDFHLLAATKPGQMLSGLVEMVGLRVEWRSTADPAMGAVLGMITIETDLTDKPRAEQPFDALRVGAFAGATIARYPDNNR